MVRLPGGGDFRRSFPAASSSVSPGERWIEPDVLLLDEPLSALDANLRGVGVAGSGISRAAWGLRPSSSPATKAKPLSGASPWS